MAQNFPDDPSVHVTKIERYAQRQCHRNTDVCIIAQKCAQRQFNGNAQLCSASTSQKCQSVQNYHVTMSQTYYGMPSVYVTEGRGMLGICVTEMARCAQR